MPLLVNQVLINSLNNNASFIISTVIMEQLLYIANIIITIGWALIVILIVILLLYLIRLALIAKGIIWGVKETVESAQQSILSPMSMIGSFFSNSVNEFDEDDEI